MGYLLARTKTKTRGLLVMRVGELPNPGEQSHHRRLSAGPSQELKTLEAKSGR